MRDFFFVAASLVIALVAIGLVRILRGPQNADRMMAGQLLGSGSIAVLLLAAGGGSGFLTYPSNFDARFLD
jgi:multicomponent Na+:H+ antiporter subunit F